MPNFTALNSDEVKEITCHVCFEPWDDPREVEPCGHIFCERCINGKRVCPQCQGVSRMIKIPNRLLVNIANEATVRCVQCQWAGTREAARRHVCVSPAVCQPPVSPPPQIEQAPWTEFGMSQQEYDHIMCVFMTFDAEGNGRLNHAELSTLCRYLNYAQQRSQIDEMFREMDTDHKGQLTMREFCSWVSTHRPNAKALYGMSQVDYDEALFAFHAHDRDRDGLVSEGEFVQLCLRQGWAPSKEAAKDIFTRVDTDRDGAITLHDFLLFRGGGLPAAPPLPVPVLPSVPSLNPPPPPRRLSGTVAGINMTGRVSNFFIVISTTDEIFATAAFTTGNAIPLSIDFSVPLKPHDTQVVFRLMHCQGNVEVGGTAVLLEHVPCGPNSAPFDQWLSLKIVQGVAVGSQPVQLRVVMRII